MTPSRRRLLALAPLVLATLAPLSQTGCSGGGQGSLAVISGSLNDPANRTLRRQILSYGLDQFCTQLRQREAPLKMTDDGPIEGRFYPTGCVQKQLDTGDLVVDMTGVGSVYNSLTKRLGFSMHATVQYDDDFLMDGGTMYAYFRTKSLQSNDFATKVIESQLASFVNQLSPTADTIGKQLLSANLQKGFTVIRDSSGNADFGLGIIDKGTHPQHPYDVHGSDRITFENDRTEVHQNERDVIGPIVVADKGRALYLTANLDGAPALDVMILAQAVGDAAVQASTSVAAAGPLVGPPLLGEALQQGVNYQRTMPAPQGTYYVVFDNTSTAGVVNPSGGPLDDRAGMVKYLIQIGDAP